MADLMSIVPDIKHRTHCSIHTCVSAFAACDMTFCWKAMLLEPPLTIFRSCCRSGGTAHDLTWMVELLKDVVSMQRMLETFDS